MPMLELSVSTAGCCDCTHHLKDPLLTGDVQNLRNPAESLMSIHLLILLVKPQIKILTNMLECSSTKYVLT